MQYQDFINQILCGDCLEIMKQISDNSIDSVVTDPPYGIAFMGKNWDKFKQSKRTKSQVVNLPAGMAFPNKEELNEYQQWCTEWAKECLRVLKPGGHMLSACGTRTYHRMTCAIEDAGFEVRDTVAWVYGQGFPKSMNISKSLMKKFEDEGVETGEIKKHSQKGVAIAEERTVVGAGSFGQSREEAIKRPTHPKAKEYDGLGTALKPAMELFCLARKPISEKTIAENVLKWGTGGLNIDGCRIEYSNDQDRSGWHKTGADGSKGFHGETFKIRPMSSEEIQERTSLGRFPSNLIHDGSEEVLEEFKKAGDKTYGHKVGGYSYVGKKYEVEGFIKDNSPQAPSNYGDCGSAARFFYCAKASKGERNKGLENIKPKEENLQGLDVRGRTLDREDGTETLVKRWKGQKAQNNHPTVKPLDLMKYLCRLITPKNGVVLDPFVGSGTTCIAAKVESFNYIGIDREEDYCEISRARIDAWQPEKKARKLF